MNLTTVADLDGAVYWAHVILTHGRQGAQRLLAKQCWIIAAEVCDDDLARRAVGPRRSTTPLG